MAMPSAKLCTVSASTITAALEDIPKQKKERFTQTLLQVLKYKNYFLLVKLSQSQTNN